MHLLHGNREKTVGVFFGVLYFTEKLYWIIYNVLFPGKNKKGIDLFLRDTENKEYI